MLPVSPLPAGLFLFSYYATLSGSTCVPAFLLRQQQIVCFFLLQANEYRNKLEKRVSSLENELAEMRQQQQPQQG
jgi:hypothetical protein